MTPEPNTSGKAVRRTDLPIEELRDPIVSVIASRKTKSAAATGPATTPAAGAAAKAPAKAAPKKK